MKQVAGGLRALWRSQTAKAPASGRGEETPARPQTASRRTSEASATDVQRVLSWQDIRRVGRAREVWSKVRAAADDDARWLLLPELAEVVGRDPQSEDAPLGGFTFKQVFDDGSALTEILGRLLARRVRSALCAADTSASTRDLLISTPCRSALDLLAWLAAPGTCGASARAAIGALAHCNAPSLLALAAEAASCPSIMPSQHSDESVAVCLEAVFGALMPLSGHTAAADDLRTGGGLASLYGHLSTCASAPDPPKPMVVAARCTAELFCKLAAADGVDGRSAVLSLKPVQKLLSAVSVLSSSPSRADAAALLSKLLHLLSLVLVPATTSPAPSAADLAAFNEGGGAAVCANAIAVCDGPGSVSEAEVGLAALASLCCTPQTAAAAACEEPDATALFYTPAGDDDGDGEDHVARSAMAADAVQSICSAAEPGPCRAAQNAQCFVQLTKLAAKLQTPVLQLRAVHEVLGILSAHPANFARFHRTRALAQLISAMESVGSIEAQCATVQVLQYVVLQIGFRPQKEIMAAVSAARSPTLPLRTAAELFRTFLRFLRLDPVFLGILRDAGVMRTCVSFFSRTHDEGALEADMCTAAASCSDLATSLLQGPSTAATQNLATLAGLDGVRLLARCAAATAAPPALRAAARKLLDAAVTADGTRQADTACNVLSGAVSLACTCARPEQAADDPFAPPVADPQWPTGAAVLLCLLRVATVLHPQEPFFARLTTGQPSVHTLLTLPLLDAGSVLSVPPAAGAAVRACVALAACVGSQCPGGLKYSAAESAAQQLCVVMGPVSAFWELLTIGVHGVSTDVCDALSDAAEGGVPPLVHRPSPGDLARGAPACLPCVEAAASVLHLLEEADAENAMLALSAVATRSPVRVRASFVPIARREFESLRRDLPNAAPGPMISSLLPRGLTAGVCPDVLKELGSVASAENLSEAARCVTAMCSTPRRWADVITFRGAGSCLAATAAVPHWPPVTCLQIGCWFQMGKVCERDAVDSMAGVILCRLTWRDTDGRTVYVQLGSDSRGRLSLAAGRVHSDPQVCTFGSTLLAPATQHFVMVGIPRTRGAAEAVLMVDGEEVERQPFKSKLHAAALNTTGDVDVTASVGAGYPRSGTPFAQSHAAGSGAGGVVWAEIAQLRVHDSPLHADTVRAMYALGPTYKGTLHDAGVAEGLLPTSTSAPSTAVVSDAQLKYLYGCASADAVEHSMHAPAALPLEGCEVMFFSPAEQSEGTCVARTHGQIVTPPKARGCVTSIVWSRASCASLFAARGTAQQLLAWALGDKSKGQCGSAQVRQVTLAVLQVMSGTGADDGGILQVDFGTHSALAALLLSSPQCVDKELVEALVDYGLGCAGFTAVLSVPMVRWVLLDARLLLRIPEQSTVHVLNAFAAAVTPRHGGHASVLAKLATLRLLRDCDLCGALLLVVVGEPSYATPGVVAQAACRCLRSLLRALEQFPQEVGLLRCAVGYVTRVVLSLLKPQPGASQARRNVAASLLLKLLCDVATPPQGDVQAARGSPSDPDGSPRSEGSSILPRWSPQRQRSRGKDKPPQAPHQAHDTVLAALLRAVPARWFVAVLSSAAALPCVISLTLRLLCLCLRSSRSFADSFVNEHRAWQVLAGPMKRHCNQPEVLAWLVSLLRGGEYHQRPAPLHEFAADLERGAVPAPPGPDPQLLALLVSLAGAMCQLPANSAKLLSLQPIQTDDFMVAAAVSAGGSDGYRLWSVCRLRLRALRRLRKRMMPAFETPPTALPAAQEVDVSAAVALAKDVARCVMAAAHRPRWLLGFARSDEATGAAVAAIFASVGGSALSSPLPQEATDDFVFVLDEDLDGIDIPSTSPPRMRRGDAASSLGVGSGTPEPLLPLASVGPGFSAPPSPAGRPLVESPLLSDCSSRSSDAVSLGSLGDDADAAHAPGPGPARAYAGGGALASRFLGSDDALTDAFLAPGTVAAVLLELLSDAVRVAICDPSLHFTSIGESRQRRKARAAYGVARLHHVLSVSPPGTSDTMQQTFQCCLLRQLLTSLQSESKYLSRDIGTVRNLVSLCDYLASRVLSGAVTPIPNVLSLGHCMLRDLDLPLTMDTPAAASKEQVAAERTAVCIWEEGINRIVLWLVSPSQHPHGMSQSDAVDALLSAVPSFLHPLNSSPTFLQPLVLCLWRLMTSCSEVDKVIQAIKLVVDTHSGSAAAIADMFVHDSARKRRRLDVYSGGFDRLLGGTTEQADRFREWALTDAAEDISSFFAPRHLRRYRHWLKYETRRAKKQRTAQQQTHEAWLAKESRMHEEAVAAGRAALSAVARESSTEPSILDPGACGGPCAVLRSSTRCVLPPHVLSRRPQGAVWWRRTSLHQVGGMRLGTVPMPTPLLPQPPGCDLGKVQCAYAEEPIALRALPRVPLCAYLRPSPVRLPLYHVTPKCSTGIDPTLAETLGGDAAALIGDVVAKAGDVACQVHNAYLIEGLESVPVLIAIGHKRLHLITHTRCTSASNLVFVVAGNTGSTPPPDSREQSEAAGRVGGLSSALVATAAALPSRAGAALGLLTSGLKGLRDVLVSGRGRKSEEPSHRCLLSHTLGPTTNDAAVMSFPLGSVLEIVQQRLHHEPIALEIGIEPSTSILLACCDNEGVLSEHAKGALLDGLRERVGATVDGVAARSATLSDLSQLWRDNLMSTFDYLLAVNAAAGRNRHDCNQYPVVPWVVSEYSKDTLDMDDPGSCRDLSKPMGALDPRRAVDFRRRFEDWDEDATGVPRFHYGSHYLTSMTVLWYLLRLQPFTAHAVRYQGGRLDIADRLFQSVGDAWRSASHGSSTDIKELVPELFYAGEFLENSNSLRLGGLQDGGDLDHVLLPAWADGSAKVFVERNREALESDVVAEKIPRWLDLVFGHAQRGPAAESALNVFFHLSYEGGLAPALARLQGEHNADTRWAAATQVAQFGQTPHKLWEQPHQHRRPQETAPDVLCVEQLRQATARVTSSTTLVGRFKTQPAPAKAIWLPPHLHDVLGSPVLVAGPGLLPIGSGLAFADCTGGDSYVRIRSTADGAPLAVVRAPEGCGKGSRSVVAAALPGAALLFMATEDGVVAVRILCDREGRKCKGACAEYRLVSEWAPVDRMFMLDDTSLLVTQAGSRQPRLWQVNHTAAVYQGRLQGVDDALVDVKYVRSRRWLLGCTAQTLFIWDAATLCVVAKSALAAGFAHMTCAEPLQLPGWSRNGLCVTGHSCGRLLLWEMSGQPTELRVAAQLPHQAAVATAACVGVLQRPPPFVPTSLGAWAQTTPPQVPVQTASADRRPILYSVHANGRVLAWEQSVESPPLWTV
eukprot:TRINITY_DN2630_c4_g1_i1.p1 TRINITY_DN2630_c4_g1~~TRINITY_DN2630_c4_g1_i1.p1  ORF type:complete len:3301 (+),score=579.26 TRINITY_DN2630_c4_g1_i1:116-10018(+)